MLDNLYLSSLFSPKALLRLIMTARADLDCVLRRPCTGASEWAR